MGTSSCPERSELVALLEGKLTEADLITIAPHVEECTICQARLEKLAGAVSQLELQSEMRWAAQVMAELPTITYGKAADSSIPNQKSKSDLQVPPQLGDYELISELGIGGMGVVWKARQNRLNRIVALKLIRSGQFASSSEVERFYREAKAAACLKHPAIVSIYEVDQSQGFHYFSMTYVEGKSLYERIRNIPLPQHDAASIVQRIADAVASAHTQGIVHRDLKPHNILIDEQGNSFVSDFGLAKQLDNNEGLTSTGQVLGTPGYMSPEQARGDSAQIGPLTDVYGLGAILYCCLTGRAPFISDNVIETLKLVEGTPVVAPRQLNPRIDLDLETICLKCLEKEPSQRIHSAAEVATELDRYLKNEPIHSRRPSLLRQGWHWIKRKKQAVAISLLLGLLVTTAILAWQISRASTLQQEIVELANQIETKISQVSTLNKQFYEIESEIAGLRQQNTQLADRCTQQLTQRLQQNLQQSLQKPRLSETEIASIQPILEWLEIQDANLAEELRKQLQTRVSNWTKIVELSTPFSNAQQYFVKSQIKVTDNQLHVIPELQPDSGNRRIAWSTIQTLGQGEVTLECGPNWMEHNRIGIVMDGDANQGYVLEVVINTENMTGIDRTKLTSFQGAREQQLPLSLELSFGGVLLARQNLPWKLVETQRFNLRFRRMGEQLLWQVNELPTQAFMDLFPQPINLNSKLGVICSRPLKIQRMTVLRRPAPERLSQLETADQHYHQGRYAAAIELYDQLTTLTKSEELLQEIQYKSALCKLQIQRVAEGINQLEQLLATKYGERWPAAAGTQLWLHHLRTNNLPSAELIYQTISTRFKPEQIAQYLPRHQLKEIQSMLLPRIYLLEQGKLPTDKDLADLERTVAILKFVYANENLPYEIGFRQLRLLIYLRQFPAAIQLCEQLSKDYKYSDLLRNYMRLLIWTKQTAKAIQIANDYIQNAPPHEQAYCYIFRSRAHYAQQQFAKAKQDLELAIACKVKTNQFNDRNLADIYLMLGDLQMQQSEVLAAQATWHEGFQIVKKLFEKDTTPDNTAIPRSIMMGALSGTATDDELYQLCLQMLPTKMKQGLQEYGRLIIPEKTLQTVIRQMWLEPSALIKLRSVLIWETEDLRDRSVTLARFAANQFLKTELFDGNWTDEQSQISDSFIQGCMEFINQRSLTAPEMIAVTAAWSGETGFLGWAIVQRMLPESILPQANYLYAKRLVKLNKTADALQLLEQLQKLPESKLLPKSFLQTESKLLRDQQGQIHYVNRSSAEQNLEFVAADGQVIILNLPARSTTIHTSATGECSWKLTSDTDVLIMSASKHVLGAGQFCAVEINSRYAPRQQATVLRSGYIAQPDYLPNGAKYQLELEQPRGLYDMGYWNEHLQKYAVCGRSGGIGIISADTQEMKLLFGENGHQVPVIGWDEKRRVWYTTGYDSVLLEWSKTGKLLHRQTIPNNLYSNVVPYQDGYIGFKHYGESGWGYFNRQGELVFKNEVPATLISLAIKPSSKVISCLLSNNQIWHYEDQKLVTEQAIEAKNYSPKELLWSPDAKHYAVRYDKRQVLIFNDQQQIVTTIPLNSDHSIWGMAWHADSQQILISSSHQVQLFDLNGILKATWKVNYFKLPYYSQQRDSWIGLSAQQKVVELKAENAITDWLIKNPFFTNLGISWVDDQRFIFAYANHVLLINQQDWAITTPIQNPENDIYTHLCYSLGQRQIAVERRGKVQVFDADYKRHYEVPARGVSVEHLEISKDQGLLAIAYRDGMTLIYTAEGKKLHEIKANSSSIKSIAWHPQEDSLLISSSDEHFVYQLANFQKLTIPKTATPSTWLKDEQTIASWSAWTLSFQNRREDQFVYGFNAKNEISACLPFEKDGFFLGTRNGTLFRCQKHQTSLISQQYPGNTIEALALSPNQKQLLIFAQDAIFLCDAQTLQPINSLVFTGPNEMLVLNPGGKIVHQTTGALDRVRYNVEVEPQRYQLLKSAEFEDHRSQLKPYLPSLWRKY